MTWNYRIVRCDDEEPFYQVFEIYYDGDEIRSWASSPSEPFGETPEELKGDLELMLQAFEKPILDERDLPEPEEDEDV